MNTVLITGFEPFGGETTNPSWEATRPLDGRIVSGRPVAARVLPVAFGAALETLRGHLAALRPELVICAGQAGGREGISVERVAINVDDAREPDNRGQQPIDAPVVPDGPAAYWSTLPIKAIVRALRDAGIAAVVSQTAGTYVCNHVFYGLMHALAAGGGATRGGFIHVPYDTAQAANHAGAPGMPVAVMRRALELALATALAHPRDLAEPGGAMS